MEVFYGKIKDNGIEHYKKLSGARCSFIELGGDYSIIGWDDVSDKIIMEALFDDYLENGLCENMLDHREKWKAEGYQDNEIGIIMIPENLIDFILIDFIK